MKMVFTNEGELSLLPWIAKTIMLVSSLLIVKRDCYFIEVVVTWEVSDRPPSASEIGHAANSAHRCNSPAVEAEGCQFNADQRRDAERENEATSSGKMTQPNDATTETRLPK